MAEVSIKIAATLLAICSIAWAAPADNSVAFSVGLTNTQRVSNNDVIMYDRVFANSHYSYNPVSGTFTCPVAGTYIFHFHAYSTNKDSVMWLDLLQNGNPVVSVSGYNSHTVGSQTVILNLRKGDKINVQSKEMQSFALFGLPDQIYSTFSGFLISASTTDPYMDSGIFG